MTKAQCPQDTRSQMGTWRLCVPAGKPWLLGVWREPQPCLGMEKRDRAQSCWGRSARTWAQGLQGGGEGKMHTADSVSPQRGTGTRDGRRALW